MPLPLRVAHYEQRDRAGSLHPATLDLRRLSQQSMPLLYPHASCQSIQFKWPPLISCPRVLKMNPIATLSVTVLESTNIFRNSRSNHCVQVLARFSQATHKT